MATQPSETPEWITDAAARADGFRYEAPVAEFVVGDVVYAKFINWLYYTITLWISFLKTFHTEYSVLRTVSLQPVVQGVSSSFLTPTNFSDGEISLQLRIPTTQGSDTGDRPRLVSVRVLVSPGSDGALQLYSSDPSIMQISPTLLETVGLNTSGGSPDVVELSMSREIEDRVGYYIYINRDPIARAIYHVDYSYYEIGAE